MTKTELLNSISRSFHKVGFELKKHSPEILIGVGVVGTVVSAVLACKATTKLSTITDEHKEKVNAIHGAVNNTNLPEPYTEKDMKKDLTITYSKTALKLIKLYGPSVALGAASLGCIIGSHGIIRKRAIATAAAYATVDRSFKEYRGRVIERFGEELDKELKYNIKSKEVEETVVDENGKEKTVKKTVQTVEEKKYNKQYSEYAVIYDDGCTAWTKSAEKNKVFLLQLQQHMNDRLQARGHVLLNEIYDALGVASTQAGCVMGWVYKPKDPGYASYIDFGLHDVCREGSRDFVNGRERVVIIDPNVDCNVYEELA